MKSKIKNAALILAGVMIGTSFSSPATNAAAEFFQAQRTPHPIYVDGKQVQMETYTIGGHNYVKFRDIGAAVGFEVYWDGSAAQILSNQSYTGQPPTQTTPSAVPNHSTLVDPVVFTGYLTAEVYDTIREAVLTKQSTSFGSAVSGFTDLKYGDDELLFQKAEDERNQIWAVLAALGPEPIYEMILSDDGNEYICQVRNSESMAPAVEHTKKFIASLNGLSEREKIKRISWYVCDRIAYDGTRYVWPDEVLTQDGITHGACMSYAYSFQFLCNQVGIPCVFKHGGNHQWNTVYAEGRWWDVDVTGNDCEVADVCVTGSHGEVLEQREVPFDGTDEFREQYYVPAEWILRESGPYPDEQPEITRFAQEVLVPRSSR